MRRIVIAGLGLLLVAGAAAGHFPLLLPGTPWGKLDQELELVYAFGHPFEAERAQAGRPTRWVVLPPALPPVDLLASLAPRAQEWRARYTPKERGDHLVMLTGPASEHDGKQVTDFTKLVLHVPAVQGGWDRVVGDPLEVVPLTRPYGLPVGATFRAEVLSHGEPQAHLEVEVEPHNAAAPAALPPEPFVTRVEKTDRSGAFAVTLDRAGWWIVCASREHAGGVQRAALWVFVGPPG